MPWSPSDAKRFDKDAKSSPKASRQWSHIANSALKRGDSESTAIKKASGVVGKSNRTAMDELKALKAR